jgi:ABC-type Zn uptake system ZnuABC Zn-binding protein ZnuA
VTASQAALPDSQTGIDPHVWLDPQNVVAWTTTIATALTARDPGRALEYQRGAEAYRAKLESLDAEMAAKLASIPAGARQFVTDHDEFGYFARRYGFKIVGTVIPAPSTSAEPSAQDVARLEQAIQAMRVRAIFVSTIVNPQLAQRVADDTGIHLVSLHAHSLTVGGPADTYLDLMRSNASAIAEALTP